MNARDKAILEDLKTFRVLSRDQLISLHFNSLRNPVNSCNSVLKRLSRDGLIKCNTNFSPYVYSLADSKMKAHSQKVYHFMAIADAVIEMKQHRDPTFLVVEPKFAKSEIEPDLLCRWFNNPMFVEIQLSQYSHKMMQAKIDLYESFYHSGIWEDEPWQTPDKKMFPAILIISPTRYPVESEYLKIYQAPSVSDFISSLKTDKPAPPPKRQPVKNVLKPKV